MLMLVKDETWDRRSEEQPHIFTNELNLVKKFKNPLIKIELKNYSLSLYCSGPSLSLLSTSFLRS